MIKLANEKKIIGWQNFYRIQIKTKYYGCNTNSIRTTWRTSHPNPKNIFKNPTKKNSLYFWKWNFLALIKKNSYFFSKESFSYNFSKESFSCFPKWNPAVFSPSLQNKKICPEKIVYTSGNKNREKKSYISYYILIFKEMELLSPKLKIFLIFQEGTCKDWNFVIFSQKKILFNFLH